MLGSDALCVSKTIDIVPAMVPRLLKCHPLGFGSAFMTALALFPFHTQGTQQSSSAGKNQAGRRRLRPPNCVFVVKLLCPC